MPFRRRFLQWTYLPILPSREETLRGCVREGIGQQLWAVAIGDKSTLKYQTLVERPDDLDRVTTLFDGSASLVRGDNPRLLNPTGERARTGQPRGR